MTPQDIELCESEYFKFKELLLNEQFSMVSGPLKISIGPPYKTDDSSYCLQQT